MRADLVPSLSYKRGLLRERLDGVTRNEPRRFDIGPLEERQQPRYADLSGEQTARDVRGRVLTPVGPEPAGNGVYVHPKSTQDLLFRHANLPGSGFLAGCYRRSCARNTVGLRGGREPPVEFGVVRQSHEPLALVP